MTVLLNWLQVPVPSPDLTYSVLILFCLARLMIFVRSPPSELLMYQIHIPGRSNGEADAFGAGANMSAATKSRAKVIADAGNLRLALIFI